MPSTRRSLSSPSTLFDAAVHPGREAELAAEGLEIVARPGTPAPRHLTAGTVVIRRARAEGRFTIICAATRITYGRASMESLGVACEGRGEGTFVEVDHGSGRRGWRIATPGGTVVDGTVLVKVRPTRQRQAAPARRAVRVMPPPAEDIDSSRQRLSAAVYALRAQGSRNLREDYVRSFLEPTGGAAVDTEIQNAIADLDRRLALVPSSSAPSSAQQLLVEEIARLVLSTVERRFILDEQRSTLELLEPSERDRYLSFAWNANDFPRGPQGPNEGRAENMFTALTRLRPERRANSGDTAAVRQSEFDRAMQTRLRAALTAVPGERGLQLHRDASASFVQMRTAAQTDGVTLSINNSYRPAAVAQGNAARADNPLAVASFSSHTLGLAVDLNMSHGGLRFAETTTRPFRNVVDMYKSPVHKWMFLRGESHGWYPYRREPWHWEYNPPGFRERLRAPADTAPAGPPQREEEGINDPLPAARAALAIRGSVGRGGQNAAADVLAVQQRLIDLRVLEQSDAASERPSGPTNENSLPRTIAAIESFQRQMATSATGKVEPASDTRIDLDRAIPAPTGSEFTAVSTERQGIRETVSRGLTLTGPVGAVASGNAVDDVRAVQRRLVDIGTLPATHREAPSTSAAVPQAQLRATIHGLREAQTSARFWVARGTISGTITPGVAAPADATATFLDRLSAYTIVIGSHTISFHDHVPSGVTASESGVSFVGTASPARMALADYQAIGLTPGQAAALMMVSKHEGNFDAINTYDRALVSAGFIQFAGSRGLPGYLARLKVRYPATFRDLLQKFGIDVEFVVAGNVIKAARTIVLDPGTSSVLRGTAAESAIRDDKKLTAALIVSGRTRDVQLAQIEAAVADYVFPALHSVVSWAAGARAKLEDLLRSQKGMAALFDRSIQEGVGAGVRRFERVLQRMARVTPPNPAPSLTEMQRHEGDLLSEIERDLQAAADVSSRVARARTALQGAIRAAGASGAALSRVLALPEIAAARRAVIDARSGLASVINVAPSRNTTVDATLAAMNAALTNEDTRLSLTPAPASLEALVSTLNASRQALAAVAGPVATSPLFLARIQRIRRSSLDTGRT